MFWRPAAAPSWTRRPARVIARRGVSVWLRADLDVLVARVSRRSNRPLLQAGRPARRCSPELIERRHPIYAEADIVVDSGDGSAEQTVNPRHRRAGRLSARAAAARTRRASHDARSGRVESLRVELGERSYDILVGPG